MLSNKSMQYWKAKSQLQKLDCFFFSIFSVAILPFWFVFLIIYFIFSFGVERKMNFRHKRMKKKKKVPVVMSIGRHMKDELQLPNVM